MADPLNYENGSIPWITSQDVKTQRLNKTTTLITAKGAAELNLYPAGSLVIVARSGILRHMLPVAELQKPMTVNQDIRVIIPTEALSGHWLLGYLEGNSRDLLLKYGKVGTTVESINFSEMKAMELMMPSKEEQFRIGALFSKLDSLIALHQRKHEKLKTVKQSLLEKMFPREGEDVPEIRFEGFTEPWEQHEFGSDLVSVETGTNQLGSVQDEGTPLLKMGNIQHGYFILSKLEHLPDGEKVAQGHFVHYGDFLFNTRNTLELVGKGATWIGESKKYAFNSNIARFEMKGIDTFFFNYLYNTNEMIKQIHSRAMGTTSVAAIYPHSLKSIFYYAPPIDEQHAIGKLLLKLDSLIALHQRELEILKNLKKAMLEKIFV